jgi:NADH pyrophosphatase NudC (nudix superfamily)
MESGESPWNAVVREVEEEVGILVRVVRLLGIYSVPKKDDLNFNFLCTPIGGSLRLNSEADDIQWFRRESIPANTLPRHVERIADAYANSNTVVLKIQT